MSSVSSSRAYFSTMRQARRGKWLKYEEVFARHTPAPNQKARSIFDRFALAKSYAGSELTGELEGYRSLKAKRYRIIYSLNGTETSLEIYLVGHRRDVYATLRSLLLGVNQ